MSRRASKRSSSPARWRRTGCGHNTPSPAVRRGRAGWGCFRKRALCRTCEGFLAEAPPPQPSPTCGGGGRGGEMRMRIVALLLAVLASTFPAAAQAPQRGGILVYAASAEPPTYDCHQGSTFAVMHTVSPHYS